MRSSMTRFLIPSLNAPYGAPRFLAIPAAYADNMLMAWS